MNGIMNSWPRYEPWAFRLTVLLLLLVLAQGIATLMWRVATPPPAITSAPPRAAYAVTPQAAISGGEVSTATRQLFGEPAMSAGAPITDAPETKLDLKLIGVFATGDSSSLAIIASGRRPESLYAIGDALPGGAILRAVYADRVILERNGALEALRLPQESLGGMVSNEARSAGATDTGGDLAAQLQQYRREAMRNPAQMAEYIEAQPVQQGGSFLGYRLILKKDLPAFDQLGFRPGDIVTEVNGVKLDQPDAGIRALRQLATARELNVTVLRNGRTETLQAQFGR